MGPVDFDYEAVDLPGGVVRSTVTSEEVIIDPHDFPFPLMVEITEANGNSIIAASTLIFDESALEFPADSTRATA